MKNLSVCTLLYTFLILLAISCKSGDIVGQHERCTHLDSEAICTDERIEEPPVNCVRFEDEKHTFICQNRHLLGYQCTSPESYQKLADKFDEIAAENKKLKRQLRQCQSKLRFYR